MAGGPRLSLCRVLPDRQLLQLELDVETRYRFQLFPDEYCRASPRHCAE